MADLLFGVTHERTQAISGAVDFTAVANGGSYSVSPTGLPTSSQTSYLVVQAIVGSGEITADVAQGTLASSLTRVGVYVNNDYRGTDDTHTVSEGDIVRVVYELTDDGSETTVTGTLGISFTGGLS